MKVVVTVMFKREIPQRIQMHLFMNPSYEMLKDFLLINAPRNLDNLTFKFFFKYAVAISTHGDPYQMILNIMLQRTNLLTGMESL